MAPDMLGECVISLVLSHCSKNLKQQTSVTARFYLASKGKNNLRHEGRPTQKRPQSILASFFLYVCLLPTTPWACPMQTGLAKKGVCLFHLKFSLWSSDLPLFHFCRLLPSLSFSHWCFQLLFPSLTGPHSAGYFWAHRCRCRIINVLVVIQCFLY